MRLTMEWYDTNPEKSQPHHFLCHFSLQLHFSVTRQKLICWCVLLCHSQMFAEPPLMQFPWSGESYSSLSPNMFGESVMDSYKLDIQPWLHATGRAFLTSLMLLMKTSLVTSGSSKVSHEFFFCCYNKFLWVGLFTAAHCSVSAPHT